jgi:hypothetical protein
MLALELKEEYQTFYNTLNSTFFFFSFFTKNQTIKSNNFLCIETYRNEQVLYYIFILYLYIFSLMDFKVTD